MRSHYDYRAGRYDQHRRGYDHDPGTGRHNHNPAVVTVMTMAAGTFGFRFRRQEQQGRKGGEHDLFHKNGF